MDALTPEAKHEIVELIFPDLRYGGDPDIERYFELRKAGRLAQALSVYNGALRVRYPEDASRVRLLKLFRENDPRYGAFQESLVLDFATRLCARILSNIDLIVAPLERADLSDALRALKAVESVLSRLPGEVAGALDLLSRYDRFARVLGHREALVRRALDLVREYDAVSRADNPSEYDFVARSAAIEERRMALSRSRVSSRQSAGEEENYDFVSRSASLERKLKSAKAREHRYFDPARIKFSEADKAQVEISPALTRREDRVLALCAKYWQRVGDAAFERMVFLYSRKFGGRYFEVFRAIKIGRGRGSTDDEILSAVAAILTTSYSYSVSGDLYMQIMWRRLRARMEARAVELRLAAPGPEAKTRAGPAVAPESRVRARKAALSAENAIRDASEEGAIPLPPAGDESPTRIDRASPKYPFKRARAPLPAPARARPATAPRAPSSAGTEASRLRPAAKVTGSRLLVRAPSGPEPVREIKAKGGSISDSIRKLSGRTYDVYREIFIERVRDHIHRALLASQTRSHGLFDTAANDAEDQIYGFITGHYDDPFMDWEHSAEREVVEALGFSMPSLAPIIESCFKKL